MTYTDSTEQAASTISLDAMSVVHLSSEKPAARRRRTSGAISLRDSWYSPISHTISALAEDTSMAPSSASSRFTRVFRIEVDVSLGGTCMSMVLMVWRHSSVTSAAALHVMRYIRPDMQWFDSSGSTSATRPTAVHVCKSSVHSYSQKTGGARERGEQKNRRKVWGEVGYKEDELLVKKVEDKCSSTAMGPHLEQRQTRRMCWYALHTPAAPAGSKQCFAWSLSMRESSISGVC